MDQKLADFVYFFESEFEWEEVQRSFE